MSKYRHRNNKTLLMGVLFCIMIFMGIGYAVSIKRLNVGSTGTVAGSWDIKITNISNVTTGYATVDSEKTVIKDNGKAAVLVSKMFAPKDKVVYNVTVTNNGNINAYLQSLIIEEDNENEFIKITNTITEYKKIDAGQSITFDVIVEFLNYGLNDIPNNLVSNFTIIPTYVQEANSEDMNIHESVYDTTYKVNNSGEITEYNYKKGNYVEIPAQVEISGNDGGSLTRDITTITEDSFKHISNYDVALFQGQDIVIRNISGQSYETIKQMTLDYFEQNICISDTICMYNTNQKIKENGTIIPSSMLSSIQPNLMLKYYNGNLIETNNKNEADVIVFDSNPIVINASGSDYTSIKNSLIEKIEENASTECGNDSNCIDRYIDEQTYYIQPEGSSVPSYADASYMNYDKQTKEMSGGTEGTDIKVLDLSKATNLTTIEANSFKGSTTLTTVILPDNRDLNIASSAFENCPNLTLVTTASEFIDARVLRKDKYSVSKLEINNKPEIKKVDNSTSSLTIGNYAFRNSNIEILHLPNNTTSIGNYAFYNNKIENVTIPASVTSIGNYAFQNNQLNRVTFLGTLPTIALDAFGYNQIKEATVSNANDARAFKNNPITKLTLTNCSTFCSFKVDGVDFSSETITDLTINSGIIPNYAFKDQNITKLTLGEGVAKIGGSAFYSNQISQLDLSKATNLTTIGSHAFRYNQIKNLINLTNIVSIEGGAFDSNQIEELSIPSNVTLLGEYAFSSNNMEVLDLSNATGLRVISSYSFRYNQLESVVIPSNVSEIKNNAFEQNQIVNLVIPSSVTSIGSNAFKKNKLSSLDIRHLTNLNKISSNAFCSNEIVSLYMGNSVEEIGASAFSDNLIESLNLPASVNKIEQRAFGYNKIGGRIVIPSSVTSMGIEVFLKNKITEVDLSNATGISTIPNRAFEDNLLTSITIPNNITTIGEKAFLTNRLQSISLPSGITSIGSNAFNTQRNGNTKTLTSITVNMSQSDFESNVTLGSNWYDTLGNPTFTYNP